MFRNKYFSLLIVSELEYSELISHLLQSFPIKKTHLIQMQSKFEVKIVFLEHSDNNWIYYFPGVTLIKFRLQ
jgi:hypothetical protein